MKYVIPRYSKLYSEWAEYSAKALSDIASAVSLHYYAGYPSFIDPEKREEDYYSLVRRVEKESLPLIRHLREHLGDADINISFDEWNAWYVWYRSGSVCEGIFASSFINMILRNANRYGVSMCCHFESVNEGSIKVYPDRVQLSPTGQAISIMKNHAGGTVCAITEDLVSTMHGETVVTTLLNRSFDKEKKFTVNNCGNVLSAELYSSDEVVTGSVFEVSPLSANTVNGTLEVILPPHSIAIIRTAAV